MSGTKYTISQAAKIIGKNRTTVDRHLKAGKLSCEISSEGLKVIDASELARAYNLTLADLDQQAEAKPENPSAASRDVSRIQAQLIEEYQDRIARLEQHLEKALDITPLLEDRTAKDNAWEASLDATIAKVTAQTEQQIATLKGEYKQERERRDKEVMSLKRALKAERQKSFWEKLFA